LAERGREGAREEREERDRRKDEGEGKKGDDVSCPKESTLSSAMN
jgi:hypothetical protein